MAASTPSLLSYSAARSGFKGVLDRAETGLPVGVHRGGVDLVVLDLRRYLQVLRSGPEVPRPIVVEEDGGWSVLLPGVPVAADGATLEDAVGEFIGALQEYADDWVERLRDAPNHADNWALVHFVHYSDASALLDWVAGGS